MGSQGRALGAWAGEALGGLLECGRRRSDAVCAYRMEVAFRLWGRGSSQEVPLYLGSTLDSTPGNIFFPLSPSSASSGLTLDVELDDLLHLIQRGGDLANVGPLVLQSEAGEAEGGIPGREELLRLQGSALSLGPPLPHGPAVHWLAVAPMLQPPLHSGEVQAWCHGEAAVQGG